MDITKASGAREPFARHKLSRSLALAGTPGPIIDKVASAVENEVTHGMTTSELSRKASSYLALEDVGIAARYSLKHGIMELGPAGFLFERYIEAVLQKYGYTTHRDLIMSGECVTHEIDLTAEKGDLHYLMELKYHNQYGYKTHVDVVMYAYARLLDIAPKEEIREHHNGKTHAMWVLTNTKFTSSAIQYARCRGVRLTGWTYPHGESLEDLIIRKNLYPVTTLPAVTTFAREQFARHGIMFAIDLAGYSALDLAKHFDIHPGDAERIVHEAQKLV